MTRLALPAPSPARELEHAMRAANAAQDHWMRTPHEVTGSLESCWQMLDAQAEYLRVRGTVWGW